ncbi:MAG: MraY family glycosyltransferase, partial [Dokdonella sp.]
VPTPVIGGVAMLAGIAVATLCAVQAIDASIVGFLCAGAVLVVVGLLDDKFDIDWKLRILAQVVAALLMIYVGGVRVDYLGEIFGMDHKNLGRVSVPFTVFATVGIINAVNMVDGADGLAGLLVGAALVMLGAAAVYSGNHLVFARTTIVLGAVSAFLLYNIRHPWQHRARCFMGNAGSAMLGLTIAWITVQLTQNPAHPVTPVLALWLVPIPLMDCLVLMLRRLKLGHSPFRADRNHIHHLMFECGFTPTITALALAAFSAVCGLCAGLVLRADVSHNYLLGGFFVLCIAWYWMTSRRGRALAFFGGVRSAGKPRIKPPAEDDGAGEGAKIFARRQ